MNCSGKSRQQLGQRGEHQACRYLQQQGLRLKQRNYRCRRGEIDLIMEDGDTLVFVEVRYRRPSAFGGGAQSINRQKQLKLLATAQHYLQSLPSPPPPCRIDIISIDGNAPDHARITWLCNAIEQA